MTIINKIARRFSSAADTYDAQAQMQRYVAEQLAYITAKEARDVETILEIGCGTGLLTEYLAKYINPTRFVLNDISEEMLGVAQARFPNATTLLGNAEETALPQADIIASASTVQWFESPLDFVKRASEALNTNGLLAIATYGPQTYMELRNGVPATDLYPSFSDWQERLAEHFDVLQAHEQVNKERYRSRMELLRIMALTGVGTRRGKTVARVPADIDTLTYEVYYFVARKR